VSSIVNMGIDWNLVGMQNVNFVFMSFCRTVAVYPDAPYPAALVSIYTAHFDYLLNSLKSGYNLPNV
jgi:hypothetical protein